VTQYSKSGAESDLDVDIETSASVIKGSTLTSNKIITNSADFFTPVNYTMEDIDWSNWESVFDVSAALSPMENDAQVRTPNNSCHGSQPHLNDLFAGTISPSNSGSRISPDGNLFDWLYPSPPQSVSAPVFSCVSISAGSIYRSSETFGFAPQAQSAPKTMSSPFGICPSHTREPKFSSISTTGDCCANQCNINLTTQLTEITGFQVKGSSMALDVLLNLDDHVRKTREQILACSYCSATPRFPQTLMFLTMVLGDLLSLWNEILRNF
jgi:hypothetical protein